MKDPSDSYMKQKRTSVPGVLGINVLIFSIVNYTNNTVLTCGGL